MAASTTRGEISPPPDRGRPSAKRWVWAIDQTRSNELARGINPVVPRRHRSQRCGADLLDAPIRRNQNGHVDLNGAYFIARHDACMLQYKRLAVFPTPKTPMVLPAFCFSNGPDQGIGIQSILSAVRLTLQEGSIMHLAEKRTLNKSRCPRHRRQSGPRPGPGTRPAVSQPYRERKVRSG